MGILGVFAVFACVLLFSLLGPKQAAAATSSTINFQARLESSGGSIAPDGNYDITFHLFNSSTAVGGTSTDTGCGTDTSCEWEESYTYNSGPGSSDVRVRVANGYLTVSLGSITSFGSINWNQQQWLTMDIGGTTGSGAITWDTQMTPRLLLTATPYAFSAGELSVTNGNGTSTLSLTAPASTVHDDTVTIPDETGTVCTTAATGVCSAAGGYVQLQNATPGTFQTGNFNINTGTGILGTLQSAASQALTVTAHATSTWSTDAGNLTLQASAASSQVSIDAGTSTTGILNLANTNAATINLAGNNIAHTIHIGDGGSSTVQTITIGSAGSTSAVTIAGGTGSSVQLQSQGTILIGNNAVAQTITIGSSTASTAINLQCGAGGTCALGNNATDHSTTVGSTSGTSLTTVQSGSGGVSLSGATTVTGTNTFTVNAGASTLNGLATGSSTALTVTTNATTNVGATIKGAASQTANLLQLQDSTGVNLRSFDASGNAEQLGYTDSPYGGLGAYGNLLTQSEGFDNGGGSPWTYANVTTPSANTVVAPDGNTTAESLAGTGAGGTVKQVFTTSTNGTYTFSVWLKSGSTQAGQLRIDCTGGTCAPTTGTPSAFTATTTWQRFSVTQTITGTLTSLTVVILPGGAGTGTVSAWGAQLVQASVPQVYVRTITAAVSAGTGLINSDFAVFRNNSNSATSFVVQNASGVNDLAVDSTNDQLVLGTAGTLTGKLAFGLVGGGVTTLTPTSSASSFGITIPAEAGTLCTNNTTGVCATAGTGYVLFSPTSTQTDATANDTIYVTKNNAGGNILRLAKNGTGDVFVVANGGNITATGTYNTNTFTSSDLQFGNAGTATIQPAASRALTITAHATSTWSTDTGDLTLQASAASSQVTIDAGTAGTVNLANANATTINLAGNNTGHIIHIGDGGSSTAQTVTIGSTFGASALTLQAGTNNINLLTNSASAAIIVKTGTNSSTGFQLQNASSTVLANLDTTASTGNNLVANPSFESAVSNWSALSGGSAAQDGTQFYEGTKSLKIATNGSGGGESYNAGAPTTFLSTNTTYTLSAYVKTDSTLAVTTFEMGDSESGAVISCLTGQTLTGGWKRFTCTFTTSVTSPTNSFIYFKQTDAVNRNIYVDDVQVQTDANATSGYRNATLDLTGTDIQGPLVLQDTTNGSTALQVKNASGVQIFNVDTTDTNLISNPGIEINSTGWSAIGTSTTIRRDTSQTYLGLASLQVVTGTAADSGAQFTLNPVVTKASTNYTASFYARRANADATSFTDIIVRYSADGTITAGHFSDCGVTAMNTQTVANTGWTRFFCTVSSATTPTTSGYLLIKDTAGAAHTFYVDGVQLEESSSVSSYGAGQISFNGVIQTPTTLSSLSNSTTALQVQNASAANLLTVDTTNTAIVLGNDTTPAALTVRGGAASGSNVAGATITVDASNGTGTGGSGALIFRTAAVASGGSIPVLDVASAAQHATTTAPFPSWNHTVTASFANTLLVVTIAFASSTQTTTSVTYGGTAMTKLTTEPCSLACTADIWYMVNPPSGTHAVSIVSWSGAASASIVAGSSSYYNVNQTTPFATASQTHNTGTNVTVSPTTTVNQLVFDSYTATGAGGYTVGGSQTQLYLDHTIEAGASSNRAGVAGTTAMSWTNSISEAWAEIAVPINIPVNTNTDVLTDRLHVTPGGNVGLNNPNPQYTLDISGDVHVQSVTNSTTNFQVQNAAGTNFIGLDTLNSILNLGVTGSVVAASTINIGNTTGNATQTINIGATNSANNAVLIQGGTGASAIGLQVGASGTISVGTTVQTTTLNIGNTSASTTLTLNGGTGASAIGLQVGASGTISVGTTVQTTTINVGNASASTAVSITGGTGASAVGIQVGASGTIKVGTTVQTTTLNIGNTSASTTTLVNGGTGASAISLQAGAAGTISIGTTNDNVITMGKTTGTNQITIGQSTGAQTVAIASGITAAGSTKNINIGNAQNNSTGITAIAIGLNNTSTGINTVTIKAGGSGASRGLDTTLSPSLSTAVCSTLANTTNPTAGTAYTLGDCSTGPSLDYAEMYPSTTDADYGDVMVPGTKVVEVLDTDGYKVLPDAPKRKVVQLVKSTQAYQNSVVGIMSLNYGDFSSTGIDAVNPADNPRPIALNGHVPVKISPSSDPIAIGDYVTTSDDPGKAMKATHAGEVIGKALESWSPADGKLKIEVFVEQGYYPGPSGASLVQNGGDASLANLGVSGDTTLANLAVTGTAAFASLNVSGEATITDLHVTGIATVKTLVVEDAITTPSLTVTGIAKIQTIQVGDHIVLGASTEDPTASVAHPITARFKASKPIAPGMVVIADSQAGYVTTIATTGDTRVVGVALTAAANQGDVIEVAIGGTVKVLVSDTPSIGQLLHTDITEGKASVVAHPSAGELLGKVLGNVDASGEVLILVALQ